jgi:hypothetical protein
MTPNFIENPRVKYMEVVVFTPSTCVFESII